MSFGKLLSSFTNLVGVTAALAALASAQITNLSCPSIDGAQETPPNGSPTTGSACFTFDASTNTLNYNISYGVIASGEIAAHIHSGAPGVPGPIITPLPLGSPKIGSLILPAASVPNLLAGNLYVNIHSNAFGGGEIRGQILVIACPSTAPGNPFCSNGTLGADHTTGCPCGNTGAAANGCAHSFSAAGANLTASGSIPADTVQLFSSGEPITSFTLFMQHDAAGDVVFHDGVLCAGGTLIRLRGRAAGIPPLNPGEASFPNPAFDSSITLSQRGSVTIGSGATRYYAAWYRNASTTFCPPATANVTNGWTITW